MKLLAATFAVMVAGDRTLDTLKTLTSGRSLPAIPQVEPSHLLTGTDFNFKAEITKSGFENLALITSKDLNNWKKSGEYHFVANVRHDAVEILDTWYDGKISISNQHATGFDVKISDQQTTDYYMVIGLCDPMDSKCKDFDLSKKVYQANLYSHGGEVHLAYAMENGKPVLTCHTDATGEADLFFEPADLPFTRSGNTITAAQPPSSWFQANRATSHIKCKSPFGSSEVLRFVDITDVKTDTTPILAGWDLEHTCGSLPSNANTVKLFAGNQYEKDFIEFEVPSDGGSETKSGVTINRSGDNLKFTGIEADSDMKKALACTYYSSSQQLIGFTIPTAYDIHDEPTPRLDVSAKITQPTCGFDLTATAQDIGVCETDGATSFPPTLLQWQITKADGSVLNFPESPKETSHLPLHIPLTEDLAGAVAKCVDSRVGTDEEPRSTTATGITSIQYRQFTSDSDLQVKVANGEDNVQCMSAKFPDHTAECSDIAEIPKPSIVLCPSTFTPNNVTCSFIMKDGSTKTKNWSNPECIESINHVPCDKSAVEDCPEPPKFDEQVSEEAGGSLIWLICFAVAAVFGGVLIYLNKQKTSETYEITESDELDQTQFKSPDVEAQEKIELTAGETEDGVIIKSEN